MHDDAMASPPTPHKQIPLISEDRRRERIRVTVPVSVEVLEVFQRLAQASGASVGRSMGDWLEDTVQGALFLAETVEKAKSKPKQAVQELHSYALAISHETGSFLERMRQAGVSGIEGAEGTSAGGGAAPSEPLTPPSSNTGGKVQKTTKKPPRGSR